jgi:hypothetical protein
MCQKVRALHSDNLSAVCLEYFSDTFAQFFKGGLVAINPSSRTCAEGRFKLVHFWSSTNPEPQDCDFEFTGNATHER